MGPYDQDIDVARKLLDQLRRSDQMQYDNRRESEEPEYQEACRDRIASFDVLLAGLGALERERARDRAETCQCCGGKVWNCMCTSGTNADGTIHTCWGTHGPSLEAARARGPRP